MKKIFSFIVIAIIMLSSLEIVYASKEQLPSNRIPLLEAVSVYDSDKSLDEKITRGEFAELIAKIAFSVDCDVKNYARDVSIYDMEKDNPYYDDVSALYWYGYVKLDATGCFSPDAEISVTEAYEIAARTLGYSFYINNKIIPLTKIVSEKGLGEYVSESNGVLSRCSTYNLIYNMLSADISDLKYLRPLMSGSGIYMEERLSIYKVSGVVTDDSYTSMGGESDCEINQIAIENEIYYNETGNSDLFGLFVNGYYVKDSDNEKTLLSVNVHESKNIVTKIYAEDIIRYDNRVYYYVNSETGKEKKISIPKDVVVLYNGRVVGLNDSFEESELCPENGVLYFIDNNRDKEVDVLKIDIYNSGVVAFADVQNEKIYLQNTNEIIELADRRYTIEDSEGERIELGTIYGNDTISYSETKDKSIIRIIISTYNFDGKVNSVERYEGKEYIKTFEGGRYKVSEYAKKYYDKLEIGSRYKYYTNEYEEIVSYSKIADTDEWKIGAFIRVYSEDDDTYYLKVYSSEGEFSNLELDEKVKFISEEDTVNNLDGGRLYEQINTYSGVIRYKLNSDNLVNCIEMPLEYGRVPNKNDRLFYLVDTVTEGRDDVDNYYTKIIGTSINYGGKALINGNSAIFKIPRDLRQSDEFYVLKSEDITGGENQSFAVFGTDYRSMRAAAVIISNDALIQKSITNDWYYVVKDVSFVWDEKKNEAVYSVICADMNGVELSYFMKPEVYETQVTCVGAGNTNPIKLSPGDMIYIARENDYISKAICCFDADQKTTDEKENVVIGGIAGTKYTYFDHTTLLGSPFGSTPSDRRTVQDKIVSAKDAWVFNATMHRLFSGWVYSFEDNYMLVTNQNPIYGYNPEAKVDNGFVSNLIPFDRVIYTEISRKGVMVRKATVQDVKTIQTHGSGCSRVLVGQGSYDMRTISLINYVD